MAASSNKLKSKVPKPLPIEDAITVGEPEEVAVEAVVFDGEPDMSYMEDVNSEPLDTESPMSEVETTLDDEKSQDEIETPTEESAPPVDFVDKEPVAPPVRNVKVRLSANHSCTIGGEHYHFESGKQYNVPETVKGILLRAGLLLPL